MPIYTQGNVLTYSLLTTDYLLFNILFYLTTQRRSKHMSVTPIIGRYFTLVDSFSYSLADTGVKNPKSEIRTLLFFRASNATANLWHPPLHSYHPWHAVAVSTRHDWYACKSSRCALLNYSNKLCLCLLHLILLTTIYRRNVLLEVHSAPKEQKRQ